MTFLECEESGVRIDKWLVSKFSYSRNFFHHIIERGGVSINGKKIKKSYKTKNGDKILVDDLKRYLSSVVLDEAPKIDLPVVLEKDDFLVINKPKGVLSHPNSVWDVKSPSVVGFLYHRYSVLPEVGNFVRSGLIHRLDKDTDGLMIIVKTENGLKHFKELFQRKSLAETILEKENVPLKKCYRAKCNLTQEGKNFLSSISDGLPFLIDELVIPKVPYSVAKRGLTKIMSFEIKSDFVFLDLEILTGRTHQIRYHLSTKGLPIVGDYLYGKESLEPMSLTAYKLIFQDLDGNIVELKI